jgi:hypothetical protein
LFFSFGEYFSLSRTSPSSDLLSHLSQALSSGTGFFPTTSVVAELVEDLEALDSILAMAAAQSHIANDILSVRFFPTSGKLQTKLNADLFLFSLQLARIQRDTLGFAPSPLCLFPTSR